MPRVAVAADSPLVRAGVLALLGADSTLVVVDAPAAAVSDDDGVALRELVAFAAPDVVVWAPRRFDDHALLAVHDDAAEADARTVPVVLLADLDDEGGVPRALRAGVAAVLSRDASATEIGAAVHAAAAGLIVVDGAATRELLGMSSLGGASAVREAIGAPLTPREREVLALLAEGLPNKAIAPRLEISEHTVKAHVAAIYHKLGAGNRAEAVVAAARRGLILL